MPKKPELINSADPAATKAFIHPKHFSWIIFILLSIVWGSSFILMKGGLLYLSAMQVASLRIIFSAIVLLPWCIRAVKAIPRSKVFTVFLSGFLGSLFPAYLFCIAEEKIDSGLAGTLNALTPVFVVLTGVVFFKSKITSQKYIGIAIAFTGSLLLLFSKGSINISNNIGYASLIFLATISYGTNANVVHKYLKNSGALNIASLAMAQCSVPAVIILFATGFFNLNLSDHNIQASIFYTSILGIVGTAIATVLYYMMVKRSGAVFSSMVTYCIPVVANIWGLIFGESIGFIQIFCLLIILAGVYFANMNLNFRTSFKVKNS